MKRYIETVTGYRIRYHNPYWSKEKIMFTFDDGPIPATLDVLDILDKYKKKAVFFVVAENVKKYPQIASEIVKRGHIVGSHGLVHSSMNKLSSSEFSRNIKESFRIIKDVCGVKIKYFRPPFGQISFAQAIWAITHGVILFFWSCGVSESVKFDFMAGDHRLIVLLHDHIPSNIIEVSLKNLK